MSVVELKRQLLSGNEAVASAAKDAGVRLGVGYPGTPSTEILEALGALDGPAQWAPNEKVAFEVALGAAYGNARALVTMKHVGLNVAADPLFTAAYTGAPGGLVAVVADDPGMASSQNEQDSRRYAVAAGVPMLEPADSQEAYSMTREAFELAERWSLPVLLRLTTRVSHSKTVVVREAPLPATAAGFTRDVAGRVMIPGYARPAHRRLRAKLERVAAWSEAADGGTRLWPGGTGLAPSHSQEAGAALGIVADGVAVAHAREAAPEAAVLQVRMVHPLPVEAIRRFAASVERCVVIEEGDPVIADACRAAGIAVEDKPEPFRFGELNVDRVRRILAGDASPEPAPPAGKPPELCAGCPHRTVFNLLRDLQCIVSGDIGCYTLGALPPFDAMDTCVCMGASIGVGLGLRHVLPAAEARRVVSVIGDSTFVHSGLTGIAEMVYNPPPAGHVVIVLDNETTAMTGLQEHPATGRNLRREPAARMVIEDVCRAMGVPNVVVVDPVKERDRLPEILEQALGDGGLWVVVARRTCLLATARQKRMEGAA